MPHYFKPFSIACERNKQPILQQLQIIFADRDSVLEIGSGTGQHAVYFAENLPHLTWYTSDLEDNIEGIKSWIIDADIENIELPKVFDVIVDTVPVDDFDAIFTANTFHIMSWSAVICCIEKVGLTLPQSGILVIYGPFNFNGKYTSNSNKQFDASLKQQDSNMGIRNFEEIEKMCAKSELAFVEKITMPANNFMLIFIKNAQEPN